MIAFALSILVFLLIACRQWFSSLRLEFWQIMLGGAILALAAGQISPRVAVQSINLDVMVFLSGMFLVGQALEDSGYLAHLSCLLFRHAGTTRGLVLSIIFGAGLASGLLMNDTLAIIGTPVILLLAEKHRIEPKLLLLALAFSITTGSVPSPIGNPQNLLIALQGGFVNPFAGFLAGLLVPTLVNLFLIYVFLKFFFKAQFHDIPLVHLPDEIRDPHLARLSRWSLLLVALASLAKILLSALPFGAESAANFRLTWVAVAGAAPILLFSPSRRSLIRRLDWHTLVFFAALFVLMQAVWDGGVIQSWLDRLPALGAGLTQKAVILAVGILCSQIVSNVPLVALYLPVLLHSGTPPEGLIALAAGSTLAGNLFLLGAASNIIIVHNAERKTGATLGFAEFARIGIPLTAAQALVCHLFLS